GVLPEDPSGALVTSLFNERRAAMVLSGPWFLGEVDPAIDTRVAVLPRLDEAGGAPMRPWLTVEAAYVAAGSRRPYEAFQFIRYLTSEEAGLILTLEGGQLHSNRAVYDHPDVRANQAVQAFRAQLATAVATPNRPEMTLVWSPADRAMNMIARGAATPEAALANLQGEVAGAVDALKTR
ncbi:MAG: extracellular solute-binding protein, partial [Caulobacterales bacterium]|nr:extracellular solute-binding protein [Caulobacterales bacterium]